MDEQKKAKHPFLKFIIIIAIIGLVIFGFMKLIDHYTNPSNNDGNDKLLSRSAKYNDITISLNESSPPPWGPYTLTPHTDISNLEITIYFSNSSQQILSTKTKQIGNVKADMEYSFSFSLTDFNISEVFTISYWRYEVSGGTVSYFA